VTLPPGASVIARVPGGDINEAFHGIRSKSRGRAGDAMEPSKGSPRATAPVSPDWRRGSIDRPVGERTDHRLMSFLDVDFR
jgi:hypothetical protein